MNALGMHSFENSLSLYYRYHFNGKETDDETGIQDYGMRMFNPLLGRFFSVDPLTKAYPFVSPYNFAENTPVVAIDLNGLQKFVVNYYYDKDGNLTQVNVCWNTRPDGSYVIDNQIPGSAGPNTVYRRYFQDDGSGNYNAIPQPSGLVFPADNTAFTSLEQRIVSRDFVDVMTPSQGFAGGVKSGGKPSELFTQHTKSGTLDSHASKSMQSPQDASQDCVDETLSYFGIAPLSVYEVNIITRKDLNAKDQEKIRDSVRKTCPNAEVKFTVDTKEIDSWGGSKGEQVETEVKYVTP